MIPDWSKLAGGDCLVSGIPTLSCIPPLIVGIIYWLVTIVGIFALFLVIYSGIKFINSGGDPKSVDSAKKTLTYAIIGLLVVLFSFAIINIISYATGVSCINKFGFGNCNTGQQANP